MEEIPMGPSGSARSRPGPRCPSETSGGHPPSRACGGTRSPSRQCQARATTTSYHRDPGQELQSPGGSRLCARSIEDPPASSMVPPAGSI